MNGPESRCNEGDGASFPPERSAPVDPAPIIAEARDILMGILMEYDCGRMSDEAFGRAVKGSMGRIRTAVCALNTIDSVCRG